MIMRTGLAILMFFTISLSSFANPANLFDIDTDKIQTEMADLQALEDYVVTNDLSYDAVAETHGEYLANLDLEKDFSNTFALESGGPVGIPSFAWGFVLGIIGVGIVYFVTDDIDETKKSVWGCVASAVIGTVIALIL